MAMEDRGKKDMRHVKTKMNKNCQYISLSIILNINNK